MLEGKHRKFEELPVWMKSRELCKDIYSFTRVKPFRYDRSLCDQIQRAVVSIMSNIAEGLERGTTNELICFLFIAKGSAGEVRAQLYVAEDQQYIREEDALRLRNSAQEISYQLNNWIKSLQSPDALKGPRYRVTKSDADIKWEAGRKLLEANLKRKEEERLKGMNKVQE